MASNGQMNPDSQYSYVALFLSDANTDGSVTRIDLTQTKTPYNHATEPGIKAGELAGAPPLIHSRGILSFNTYLSGATVLTAELRLKQATSDDNFALLQPCKVDIQPGAFSGNTSLVGADYDSQDATTKLNAFQITGVGPNAWFDRDLSSLSSSVNTLGYIQFRIYFTEAFTAGKYIAWYSGDDPNNKPQLIVRYQP